MLCPSVAIIIVNWNGKQDTIDCIESFKKQNYPNYKIILVDNGSTDHSAEEIKEKFEAVIVIQTGSNLGYGGGANKGIQYALDKGFKYIFPINNDLVADENLLNELVRVGERDGGIGIISPKLLWYNDPATICAIGGKIDFNFFLQFPKHLVNIPDDGKYSNEMEIDATGIFMIKESVIRNVGMFDTKFFLYLEDFDWCIRTRNAGYKIVCVPSALMWHKGTASGGNKYTPRSVYYNTRNRFLLARKHLARLDLCLFLIGFSLITVPLRTIYYSAYLMDNPARESFLKGFKDGIMLLCNHDNNRVR